MNRRLELWGLGYRGSFLLNLSSLKFLMLSYSVIIIASLKLVPPYLALRPIFKFPRITLPLLQNLIFFPIRNHLTLSFKFAFNLKVCLKILFLCIFLSTLLFLHLHPELFLILKPLLFLYWIELIWHLRHVCTLPTPYGCLTSLWGDIRTAMDTSW
jgi:hypothetical protein